MDYYFAACKIVDLLVQGDAVEDPLWKSVRQACHDRRWNDAAEMVRLRCDDVKSGEVEDLTWSTPCWESAYDIIRGAHSLADRQPASAMERFVTAEKRLGGDESHVKLVSLFGMGLTYKMERSAPDRARATAAFSRAERIARRLAGRSETPVERQQQPLYETTSCMLKAVIAELQDTSLPRLIPIIQATAGPLRYVPGDDSAIETSYLAVADHKYRLLNYRDRSNLSYKMQSESEYFLVEVTGDSMSGARTRIWDGDKLLALAINDWQSAGSSPVVVKEPDAEPRVKFVTLGRRTITLHSSNPRYGPEIYTRGSPDLTMLGIVKAILEEQ